jgi:hypothetical protein
LFIHLSGNVGVPGRASILESGDVSHGRCDGGLGLDELHGETFRCVPSDVAMEKPRARVVFLECNGEVAVCGERCNVTTGWVNEVEVNSVNVENAGVLSNNPEIVAVQVNRMGDANAGVVLDNIYSPEVIRTGRLLQVS